MPSLGYSPLLDQLLPEQIRAYLVRKGWREIPYKNTSLNVFAITLPREQEVTLVLPSNSEFRDYQAKLRDCIKLLSDLYQLDIPTIAHNIAHWNRDVLAIRLQAPGNSEQLLPLNYAADMISQYRDLVAFAAASEKNPCKFFPKLPHAGTEHVNQCKFGHTFVGSFGLTIECPLNLMPVFPSPDFPPDRPFERAVTERIATGMRDLRQAVSDGDPDIIVRNYQRGFSGNMCDILTDVYEASGVYTISHSMMWASELAPPSAIESVSSVPLNARSYYALKTASEVLHRVEEPDEDKVIIGRITRMRSEKPPIEASEFESATRTIVIQWSYESRQTLNVHVELSLAQYRQACDAHKEGRSIRIVGKPKKAGKFWNLHEPRDFSII